ncbi:MAG: hypothetical protein WB559_16320, partial [Candidatus Acidiferrales bacterium]
STVFWQICKPPATPSTTIPPTECIAGQGPTGCTIPAVSNPISGFGTITLNGLYTAPPTVPNPATFLIVVTSCIKSNAFATFTVTIDSGITVQVSPPTASMGPGEHFQFTATVSGTANSAVVWLVDNIPGGNATDGFVCPSSAVGSPCTNATAPGEYFSPATSPGSVTVTAQSGADPTHQASATVTVGNGNAPAFAPTNPLEPTVAAQGSVQQDVYLTGTNFFTTSHVLVGGVPLPTANVTFIGSGALVRATIPAAQLTQAGDIDIAVQSQDGSNSTGVLKLHVDPVRPALIASTPNSVPLTNTGVSVSVNLTGGYFVPGNKTTATFDGIGCGGGGQVCTTFVDSRHLTVSIQDSTLNTPGLYPLLVQNSDAAAANVPSVTGLNLAVIPEANSISGTPNPTIPVGSSPSAVAIDYAEGYAVVANKSSNNVSIVSLVAPTANTVIATINVGSQPTGVGVDDLLPDHQAFVVNSADNSISVIDLSAKPPAFIKTVSLNTFEPGIIPLGTVPFAIGVNSLTHRAFVANQSTNVGTILDLANANVAAGCAAPPCPVSTITGGITPFGTGASPAVAIDPRLNWAMVTPGGTGTIAIVDLGRAAGAGDVGRLPELIGSLSITSTMQGVGINSETHQVLLTDPSAQRMTEFSLLNDAVTPVTFTVGGSAVNTPNLVASAVNPLENVGIAVQGSVSGASAVVADLESGVVLTPGTGLNGGLGGTPVAVAVDPASNEAVIVNQSGNSVGIVSLGPPPASPQILEASPAVAFGGLGTADLPLTITGAGFTGGSEVLLDGSPLATVTVVSSRQIVATVPGSMLSAAHRYIVQVENLPNAVSNVTDLTVIQAVPVGNGPVGVTVDTDRDLAIVTNSVDDTASLVSLTPVIPDFSPESLGDTGIVGQPIPVGTTPQGVAVIPRLGVAVVTNNGTNNVTPIDLTTIPPTPIAPVALCSTCSGPAGVAFNQDTATAAVATTNAGTLFSTGNLNLLTVARSTTATPQVSAALGSFPSVDQDPVAVAVDPTLNFAAVATDSSTSSLDIVSMATTSILGRVNGLQNPSGVVFDPVNQVFLTVNSLVNNIVITNPATLTSSNVSVGIAPTSIDYDFQTSSLVTVNAGSHVMSVLDYVCPPAVAAPACSAPQVRAVLGLGGAQTSSLVLGPNAVAIDPKLGLAVLVDPDNNRVLLVPLPH